MRRAHAGSFAVLAAAVILAGCGAFAMTPLTGALYTDVRAPLTATAYPSATKEGTAVCTSILGLVATGDCSIGAAMRNGGITRVQHVDYRTNSILGLFATLTVIVRGE